MSPKRASESTEDIPESAMGRVESDYDDNANADTRHLVDLYEDDSIDPVYQAKARVINRAIQDIGMGRYQVSFNPTQSFDVGRLTRVNAKWYLFIVAGFGWFA